MEAVADAPTVAETSVETSVETLAEAPAAPAERFEAIAIDRLEAMTPTERDALAFGVIGLDEAGDADVYNATESRMAGLRPERVLGQPFFMAVALCMNNFLVAQRFEDETTLDETIDFVLTLRMRPTPVKLRMLKRPGIARRYILIQRQAPLCPT